MAQIITSSIPGFGKIPWRRKWQPIPIFLSEEFHGQMSLASYSPLGQRVGHDWMTNTFFLPSPLHPNLCESMGCLGSYGNQKENLLILLTPSPTLLHNLPINKHRDRYTQVAFKSSVLWNQNIFCRACNALSIPASTSRYVVLGPTS